MHDITVFEIYIKMHAFFSFVEEESRVSSKNVRSLENSDDVSKKEKKKGKEG